MASGGITGRGETSRGASRGTAELAQLRDRRRGARVCFPPVKVAPAASGDSRPKSGWVRAKDLPPGWEGYGLEKVADTPAGALYRNGE